ncbi:MAG TPA: hypothetical protein ENK85_12060 [Saprospiraceae bacterium]|nr:hypothetical protein [Saprospiraceae bacterium]
MKLERIPKPDILKRFDGVGDRGGFGARLHRAGSDAFGARLHRAGLVAFGVRLLRGSLIARVDKNQS